jgi:hypothetical protein
LAGRRSSTGAGRLGSGARSGGLLRLFTQHGGGLAAAGGKSRAAGAGLGAARLLLTLLLLQFGRVLRLLPSSHLGVAQLGRRQLLTTTSPSSQSMYSTLSIID